MVVKINFFAHLNIRSALFALNATLSANHILWIIMLMGNTINSYYNFLAKCLQQVIN